MRIRKTVTAYIILAAIWLIFAGWQAVEHYRFRQMSYQALLGRSREIASTLGVVIRSQGRFGLVRQARLEAALDELARSTDLEAVMLLNEDGKVVASSGNPVNLHLDNLPQEAPQWDHQNNMVTIVDIVDLGSSAENTTSSFPRAIVLQEGQDPPAPPSYRRGSMPRSNWASDRRTTDTLRSNPLASNSEPTFTLSLRYPRRRDGAFRPGQRGAGISRPFWMSEKQYQELLEKQGLHGFILQIPTNTLRAEIRHDFWIRITTVMLALLAATGMGLTWRSAERMNQLQFRLLRASETNAHLRELNLAAAGLAHETRNPLNIVRGLAQIISQNWEAPMEIRHKAEVITEEVDRVTGRLNEFISYSHSPEPKPGPTNLRAVAQDVIRALESDQSEKEIEVDMRIADLIVEADESLLRQVIFNLLLNAFQSVTQGGHVEIYAANGSRGEAILEIRDDGPGVPAEIREEIFKPYFTTRDEGSGLGLALVKQISLAHQWEIGYVSGINGGAGFRISAMKAIQG